jgi:hypothetical protein
LSIVGGILIATAALVSGGFLLKSQTEALGHQEAVTDFHCSTGVTMMFETCGLGSTFFAPSPFMAWFSGHLLVIL